VLRVVAVWVAARCLVEAAWWVGVDVAEVLGPLASYVAALPSLERHPFVPTYPQVEALQFGTDMAV
jgi:hypothetical protein